MKEVISHLLLLAAFAVIFSGLSACTSTAGSQNGPDDENPANSAPSSPNDGDVVKKKSDYPPIASAVATAEIKNLDGTAFTVNDKKGRVVLLNLWATWCGPCRSEMPALVRMQDKHGAQGFEVVGLNTDDEEVAKINDFAATMKLNYPLAWADTKLQSSLLKISKFPGIPQSFLLDRDGNLRGVFRGANPSDVTKMEETVAKLMDESPQ